ncbi:MogA/MoaB family molybdenum cofactor biosynthesis protein [Heliobacterium chlorum]|uniref:MogA/MoaB family molybdenum cofactor biosynthesis protein n=1 Tax=Heliobacterium chlorum TaxID=2698 RepID=A0ABR7T437_HELCL|nr:MogA/MoaB family molybdenum cofactor biosynthesis protein [Heliobacterium chlorum]MBC9784778.1 MogA/MoaB family molybdenum cofactor biosynthesis protein [Heliobacterium chlorum]
MIRVGILTASDKGSRGEREDRSAVVISDAVRHIDGNVAAYKIVPDERELIAAALREMADDLALDLIFTTGGTGFSPRDVTPEATLAVVERLVPGIPEAIRAESMKITPRAMLTRGTAGIRGKTLIINLPGSPKAVAECLDVILQALPHGIEILKGQAGECARPEK